jgi:CMP-N,N'-diacetyllegionaminic acid synthase
MTTVAIIPARGGSKRLPGKHLRRLGGQPLIAHTVRAALEAARVDRVIVSTEDAAIAGAARRAGAEVPFARPKELAADDTPTLSVIQHAVACLEERGERIDLVLTLQATTPLRSADEIDAVVGLLDDPAVRSAVSVAPLDVPAGAGGWLSGGRFQRAALERDAGAVRITGGAYATRRDLLAEGRLLDDCPAAHVTGGAAAIDIDSEADLLAARRAWRASRR